MFKLALNAGHGYETAGKRCLKKLDPNETREYALNKRICDKIERLLSTYNGIDVLRIDDGTDIAISKRAKAANNFGADLYLSVHHNAGVKGGIGGGIEAYVYLKVDALTESWRDELYDSLIKHTALKGNRAQPLRSADFGELRQTNMPAVLLECGFMDSATDVPIILSEDFADKAAAACVEVIAKKAGLTKKEAAPAESTATEKTVAQLAAEVIRGEWGIGAERKQMLEAAGYDYAAVQAEVNRQLKGGTTSSAPAKKTNEEIAAEVIKGLWGKGADRKKRLTDAGYNYAAIQKIVNKMLKG